MFELAVRPEEQRSDGSGFGVRLCGLDEAADRARSRNTAGWQLAAQLAPYIATACRAAVATPYPVNRYAAPLADAPR